MKLILISVLNGKFQLFFFFFLVYSSYFPKLEVCRLLAILKKKKEKKLSWGPWGSNYSQAIVHSLGPRFLQGWLRLLTQWVRVSLRRQLIQGHLSRCTFSLRFPFLCSGIQGCQTETWWHLGPFPGGCRDRRSHTPWCPSNAISTFPDHSPCLCDVPICTSFCPPPAQFRQPQPPNPWAPHVLTTALSCKVWKVSEGNCRGGWLSSPLLLLCWPPLRWEMIASGNPHPILTDLSFAVVV